MQTTTIKNHIGLLATGNELTEGDILNTNGQIIARQLTDAGLSIGMHAIVSDNEADIVKGLNFLLAEHSIIITIGGLGPTSDDRTRFALSKVLNKTLIFDETSWQNIVKRYQALGIQVQPHPTNQQQALFPEGAVIIPNHNGTAAGCQVTHHNKLIYMLPGPPNECLTMFKEAVLPNLLKLQNTTVKKLKWRLLGVIESDIAAKVEEAVKNYPVVTGYRVDYPYLEVKIYTENPALIVAIQSKINAIFTEYTMIAADQSACELLKEAIINFPHTIVIEDQATHGQLQAQLSSPLTYQKLAFEKINATPQTTVAILIAGLTEFWQGQTPQGHTKLNLQLNYQTLQETINLTIPFRNPLVVKYALEYIAREILNFLTKIA